LLKDVTTGLYILDDKNLEYRQRCQLRTSFCMLYVLKFYC